MIDIFQLNEAVKAAQVDQVDPEVSSITEAYDFGCMSLGESINHFQQALLVEMVDRSHFRVGAYQIISEAVLSENANAPLLFEAVKESAIQAWHSFVEKVKKFINGIVAKAKERLTLAKGQYDEWIKLVEPKISTVRNYPGAMERTTSQAMPVYDVDYLKKGGVIDSALTKILNDMIKEKDRFVSDAKSTVGPQESSETQQDQIAKLQEYANELNLPETKVQNLQQLVDGVYKRCLKDAEEKPRSFKDTDINIDKMVAAIKEIPDVFSAITDNYEKELTNLQRVDAEVTQVQDQVSNSINVEGEAKPDVDAAVAQKTDSFQDRFSVQIQVINQVNAVRNKVCNQLLSQYSQAVAEFVKYKDPTIAEKKAAEKQAKQAARQQAAEAKRAAKQDTTNTNTGGTVAY